MHPLAFDKEGRPFTFDPRTRSLLVRRFRKPGERGTCEALFDDDGDPLQVDVDETVPGLRAAVKHVPGLYRLDQRDEHGTEVDKEAAAYIAIDPSAHAGGSGGADPLLVIRDMARDSAEVTKTIATSAAGMMNAATENMRVAIGGGVGNRKMLALLAKTAADLDEENGDDDEDDGDDDSGDLDADGQPATPPPTSPSDVMAMFTMVAPLIKPALPKLGEAIGTWIADWLNTFARRGPAAGASSSPITASPSASAPTSTGAAASATAAGPGPGADTTTASPSTGATASPSSPPPSSSNATTSEVPPSGAAEPAVAGESTTALATTPTSGEVRNAMPTGAQIGHLLAIRALLTPREVTIVDAVIARMDTPTRASWLATLSAMTVDQAAQHVRSQIPSPKAAKASRASDDAGEE